MKSSTLVTIIIPIFNEEKNIIACINSLVEQSYESQEIIVVDDGSTDQTPLLLDELQGKYTALKILKQIHQGPAKARNYAANQARGKILVFMDADMTFDKHFIKQLIDPIIEGKYKGTFSKEEYVSNWDNLWARCWNYNQGLPPKRMIPEDYPDLGLDFRAILKSEFLKVDGFDNTGYTDTWTLTRKLGYKPNAVLGAKYYHSNPDSLGEVFIQSKWSAKREYKLGMIGKVGALVRVSFPVSLVLSLIKAIEYKELGFVLFKLVYDLGAFIGILEMKKGKLAK